MWLYYPLVSSIPMVMLCPHSMMKVTCLSAPWEITLMFSPHCNRPHSNCFPPAPRVVISLHIEGVWYRIASDISQHYHLTSKCLTCTYKPSDLDSNTRALWRRREERKDSRHYRYAKVVAPHPCSRMSTPTHQAWEIDAMILNTREIVVKYYTKLEIVLQ